jgi:hypothetical protein
MSAKAATEAGMVSGRGHPDQGVAGGQPMRPPAAGFGCHREHVGEFGLRLVAADGGLEQREPILGRVAPAFLDRRGPGGDGLGVAFDFLVAKSLVPALVMNAALEF